MAPIASSDFSASSNVCKSLLFREGVPYSEQEKARALARRYRRIGERLLQLLLFSGGSAVLIRMALLAGALPGPSRWLVPLFAGSSLLAGLVASMLAVLGLRQSRRGQPGPAVPGVFPLPYAVAMCIVGLVPTMLAVLALSRLS